MDQAPIKFGFDRGDCVISFGDNVTVRATNITLAAGLAGAKAQVMGETTPSMTGVQVFGTPKRDYAINVSIEGREDQIWIDPDLLEFVDHGAGTTISIKGISKTWTRDEHGEWKESRMGFIGRMKQWFRKGK